MSMATSLSEDEADELAEKIGRHVRFKVTGRRTITGKGIYLLVTDQQTGFKHTIHSAEHWRQVFNEMVLLVEGAWEDVTLAAISQLEREERACVGNAPGVGARRAILAQQRKVLLRAFDAVQGVAMRHADYGMRRAIVIGDPHVYQAKGARSRWRGYVWIAGKKYEVGASTEAEARQRIATRRDSVVALLGVVETELPSSRRPGSLGTVYQMSSRADGTHYNLGLFRGFVGYKGKRYYTSARTYEECLTKLEVLKASLSIGVQTA